MSQALEILIVDDDAELAETLRDFLTREGYRTQAVTAASDAMRLLEQEPGIALVLADLVMPQTDGLTLMQQLHAIQPELQVVIMTGFATVDTAVDAIKRGAEDYVTKPFDKEAIRKKVGRLVEIYRLRRRVVELELKARDSGEPFGRLVYVSAAMQKVVDRARAVADSDCGVLILGETGTGKERLALAIHDASPRSASPFLPVNCGALPRDLIESELFGVRRGAFTGAYADAPGVFVSANKGTVFLDEIGEMPREAQVKLLRALQEHAFRPVGSARAVPVNIRILAATNRPLATLRRELLREDLYFRLATVVIEIPPLRSRREDILVLAQWFTARLAEKYGRHITIDRRAVEALVAHDFNGNVRELENVLESVSAVCRADPQVITEKDLRALLRKETDAAGDTLPFALDDVEKIAIERAIRLCKGNRTHAAALLGISRDTLYRKMRDLNANLDSL
ncbi:MAG: sigma-54 dependent transcriptional regulator [Terriglobales bacterium]|jgi:DNA-binding NtrC family response regulator